MSVTPKTTRETELSEKERVLNNLLKLMDQVSVKGRQEVAVYNECILYIMSEEEKLKPEIEKLKNNK